MGKVSVILPARNEQYLPRTIDDVMSKATGDIEVIVILDGHWDANIPKHNNLVVVHTGVVNGMRANINAGARLATGKYLMKLDAHCMVAEGFDEKLKADCESNWLSVPSRYSLDAEKWERGRGPTDYLYLTWPYGDDDLYGFGFHGRKWTGDTNGKSGFYQIENERRDILIDDIMAFQGSCWFMHRQHFFDIDCLDVVHYRNGMHQESQELGMKTWLSGGRVIRNKNTWYAHWHKNKQSGYGLSKAAKMESNRFSADFWLHDRWPKATRKFEWFVEKFWPIRDWPENWNECIRQNDMEKVSRQTA